jgi:phospholipase C
MATYGESIASRFGHFDSARSFHPVSFDTNLNPPSSSQMKPSSTHSSRRNFIKLAAGASLAASGTHLFAGPKQDKDDKDKGKKATLNDVQHIVVVMMENRSFDHFLGWLPGANGRQSGLTYIDQAGAPHPTHPLAPDYQGCGHPDPDHSHPAGLVEYNGGKCDGWLRAGNNDIYAIGYYTQNDLPFLGQAAPAWTTCDRYHAATLAETYPNRIYQHAAQTDRLLNTLDICPLPTIWDRLAQSKISGRYYFSDVPLLALWGSKYVSISNLISQFYSDCAAGTLPAVSFVEPKFAGEEEGMSADDHPHSDIRNGEVFLNTVYNAVANSPNWANTVMVITFDEWGGFFDHVPPTAAPIPPADAAAGNKDGLRGFRVPAVIVSPWAKRRSINSGLFDHTSILRMIEERWKLKPLTVRDSTANNLADVLDFSQTNLIAPRFTVPTGPFGDLCAQTTARLSDSLLEEQWAGLGAMAQASGFPTPPQ